MITHSPARSVRNTWPLDKDFRIKSKWQIKKGLNGQLKPGSTAFAISADCFLDEISLWINPALVWVGTYEELMETWEPVPDDTKLTF